MYDSYTAAHWPMHALEKDIAKYKGRYDTGYETIRDARYKRIKEPGVIGDWKLSPTDASWKGVDDSARAWELRGMEVYAAMIVSMDQGIGRIIETLKTTGQLDNTLIIYLQDNGGCAETYGRKPPKRPLANDIIPMAKDELQTKMIPDRTRDGRPVRTGVDAMPGPADTYIAHWPKGISARNELRREPGP